MGNIVLYTILRKLALNSLIRASSSGSFRSSALDHKSINNTVESKSVIEMLLCQFHKVGYTDRCCVRIQFHLNGTVVLHLNLCMMKTGKRL